MELFGLLADDQDVKSSHQTGEQSETFEVLEGELGHIDGVLNSSFAWSGTVHQQSLKNSSIKLKELSTCRRRFRRFGCCHIARFLILEEGPAVGGVPMEFSLKDFKLP